MDVQLSSKIMHVYPFVAYHPMVYAIKPNYLKHQAMVMVILATRSMAIGNFGMDNLWE
jgi:Tat protein secretion system quality control protein TatD with DNase activity